MTLNKFFYVHATSPSPGYMNTLSFFKSIHYTLLENSATEHGQKGQLADVFSFLLCMRVNDFL